MCRHQCSSGNLVNQLYCPLFNKQGYHLQTALCYNEHASASHVCRPGITLAQYQTLWEVTSSSRETLPLIITFCFRLNRKLCIQSRICLFMSGTSDNFAISSRQGTLSKAFAKYSVSFINTSGNVVISCTQLRFTGQSLSKAVLSAMEYIVRGNVQMIQVKVKIEPLDRSDERKGRPSVFIDAE